MPVLALIAGITFVSFGQATAPAAAPRPGQQSAPPSRSSSRESQWTPLFNGRDLSGWYTFLQEHGRNRDPDGVITIEDDAIHLYKEATEGSKVVMGYIATEKEYGDYHLRLQYRWGTKKFQPRYTMKRDAGLYYHILGEDAVWPRALQFQIQQGDAGDLLALYGFAVESWIDPKTRGAKEATYQDPAKGGEPRVLGGRGIGYQKRLTGEFELEGWNTVEVIARGDTTVHILNDHKVNEGRNIRFADPAKSGTARSVARGRIALEIEAAELYFRKVELRPLK
jgi:hypothetical protein